MKTLTLVSLKQALEISSAKKSLLSLTSPAVSVMHDFEVSAPMLIEGSTLAKDAALIMERAHVHFKLVIDDTDKLIGTLNHQQVALQNQMIKKAEGYDLSTLTVEDIMCPVAAQSALEYTEVKKSTIGHILNTLMMNGLQHCLVIDAESKTIRGVISAESVARKINTPLKLKTKPNFVELFRELHVH